jgi:hypothetical protein
MFMPIGGNVYQLLLAVMIGVVLALTHQRARREAGTVGAKASFMIGAGSGRVYAHARSLVANDWEPGRPDYVGSQRLVDIQSEL